MKQHEAVVARDPDTGQFVSIDESGGIFEEMDRHTRLSAGFATTIPAADLDGDNNQVVDGQAAQMVDFDDYLDSDEVFALRYLDTTATVSSPVTASAEGHVSLSYAFVDDLGVLSSTGIEGARPTFYFGNPVREEGIADIRTLAEDDDDTLLAGHIECAAGFGNTAGGVGGGEDVGANEKQIDFRDTGAMPLFDEDDELGINHAIDTDNIDDTAVTAAFTAVLHGTVYET